MSNLSVVGDDSLVPDPWDLPASKVNLLDVDPWSLPSVTLTSLSQLPQNPGIYFALKDRRVLYIGIAEAQSLRSRWGNHHRLNQLKIIGDVKIAYWSQPEGCALESAEKKLICLFNPELNGRRLLDPAMAQLQEKYDEDTQRLLDETDFYKAQVVFYELSDVLLECTYRAAYLKGFMQEVSNDKKAASAWMKPFEVRQNLSALCKQARAITRVFGRLLDINAKVLEEYPHTEIM